MTHRKKIGCAAAFALTVIGLPILAVCVGQLLYDVQVKEPRQRLEELLRGDPQIELTSFVITVRGERIELNDPESLRYLTTAIRTAEHEGHFPKRRGVLSEGRVTMTGGTWDASVIIEVPESADGMTLGAGMDRYWELEHHWMPLPEPRPARVTEALKRLARPPASVK